ncbi:BZ3500_MvSof-1268-A1-R1_Chr2-3g05214 [Microbotryum saponariae]|uniref:BZ3500_MvSof-1268-A1-R1_Chr2-3g05214 protein n=1 Tax=Microbotryum saponariae TaxID=289078 RepID=A0A2X0KB29_9BASI|nr:BZ3500_MvSof-1268-A1-R1_Chr2-3g05214 [Microbotryum saponariae]SDA01040.1 BZ3501_MvSof-1269-A2-R1_Chr2-2g04887 [Microbotryum saponariae]
MRLLAWRGRPPLKPPPPLRTPAGSCRPSSTWASLRASSATTRAAGVVGAEDTVADELDTNHGANGATRPRPRSVPTTSFFTRIYHRFGSTPAQASAAPSPPPARPEQLLERLLSSLPRMANSASAVRLQHRSRDDVRQELYAWKRACAAAYVALDGPLRDTQSLQLHERIIKVVAHTLRLLIRTDQVHAAAELDKAFFTSSPNVVVPFPLLLNTQAARAIVQQHQQARHTHAQARHHRSSSADADLNTGADWLSTSGLGLGLYRGNISMAWMQALALRLDSRAFETLDSFGQLLALLHDEQGHTPQGIDPHIVAFLVRKAPQLEKRLCELGASEEVARAEMSRLILAIRNRTEFENDLVVRLSVVESALQRLEQGLWDQDLFNQVERDVRTLIDETEDTGSAELGAAEDFDDLQQEPLKTHAKSVAATPIELVHQRAQILSASIRFVLYRGQAALASDHAMDDARALHRTRMQFRQSISTATQLYEKLLQLTPLVSHSPRELGTMRERQSGALYRILWASIGSSDHGHPMPTPDHDKHATMTWDPHTLQQALHAVSHTCLAVVDIPLDPCRLARRTHSHSVRSGRDHLRTPVSDPRIIGISTEYWRQLLTILSLPAAPSRRSPPRAPATRPPWIVLKRTLETMLLTRQYDASRRHVEPSSSSARTDLGRSIRLFERPLFVRRAFVHHLVRAVLLGGSDPTRADESTISHRVEWFLSWIDAWCETIGNEGRKALVREAFGEVLRKEERSVVGFPKKGEVEEVVRKWARGKIISSRAHNSEGV